MRILVVFGSNVAREAWYRRLRLNPSTLLEKNNMTIHKPGDDSYVRGEVIQNKWDVDRLLGHNFDVVMEDISFSTFVQWPTECQARLLRP